MFVFSQQKLFKHMVVFMSWAHAQWILRFKSTFHSAYILPVLLCLPACFSLYIPGVWDPIRMTISNWKKTYFTCITCSTQLINRLGKTKIQKKMIDTGPNNKGGSKDRKECPYKETLSQRTETGWTWQACSIEEISWHKAAFELVHYSKPFCRFMFNFFLLSDLLLSFSFSFVETKPLYLEKKPVIHA